MTDSQSRRKMLFIEASLRRGKQAVPDRKLASIDGRRLRPLPPSKLASTGASAQPLTTMDPRFARAIEFIRYVSREIVL